MSRADSTVEAPPAPDAGAGKASSLLRRFCATSWIAAAHLFSGQETCDWLAGAAIRKRRAASRMGCCTRLRLYCGSAHVHCSKKTPACPAVTSFMPHAA